MTDHWTALGNVIAGYKERIHKLEAQLVDLQVKNTAKYEIICNLQDWLELAEASLKCAGYEKTPTGAWKPPLGKRPDFEGQDVIKAALALTNACDELRIKCRDYEMRV